MGGQDWRSTPVLITGGAGFIGSHLTRRLAELGAELTLIMRPGSESDRIRDLLDRVRVIVGDISRAEDVLGAVNTARPRVVFHLASSYFNPPDLSPDDHCRLNVAGTLNVLQALRLGGGGAHLVFTGSAAEYGSGSSLTEDSPMSPATLLGATKAAATLLIQTYARLHSQSSAILRVFTPYGPQDREGRLVNHVIRRALEGRPVDITHGAQQRDFFFVADLVDALLLAGARTELRGEVFNVCSGRGLAVRDIVSRILGLMGNPVELLPGSRAARSDEIMELSGSPAKAERNLGWRAATTLEEGLKATIEAERARWSPYEN